MAGLIPGTLRQWCAAAAAAILLCSADSYGGEKKAGKGDKMRISTGMLLPCPASPNCINSFSTMPEHYATPFSYVKSRDDAKQILMEIIGREPRTKLVKDDGSYLHYEFTSLVFRFTDDVEFYFDDQGKTIHFRSASRKGYSDFGVNRKRIERIRTLIAGKL